MLRVRYVPPIWVGFWVHNSLSKGPLFDRFSLKMGGFSKVGQKIVINGQFSAKIHYESGHYGNCR